MILLFLQFVQLHCISYTGKLTKIENTGDKTKYTYSYINKVKEPKELVLNIKTWKIGNLLILIQLLNLIIVKKLKLKNERKNIKRTLSDSIRQF